MPNGNQPPFWLALKKEYIIENFDSLVGYLSSYNYINENEAPESDFNRTYECLKELVYDYLREAGSGCLFRNVFEIWGDKSAFVLKTIVAYLLTGKTKKGVDDLEALSQLADLLLLKKEGSEGKRLLHLKRIIMNCVQGRPVQSLGLKWSQLKEHDSLFMTNLPILLCNTKFQVSEDDEEISYFEKKGVIIVKDDKVIMSPMAFSEYESRNISLSSLFGNESPVDIRTKERKTIPGISKVGELCNDITQIFQNANLSVTEQTPTHADKTMQDYQKNDKLVVRITDINYYIKAESIDPSYHKISGNVNLKNNYQTVGQSKFKSSLKVGDYIYVTLQSKSGFPFDLEKTFDAFYNEFAERAIGGKFQAVYYSESQGGVKWLTNEGLPVFVSDTPSEEVLEAKDSGRPIVIDVSLYTDGGLSGHYSFDLDSGEDPDNEFADKARESLVRSFVEYSESFAQEYLKKKSQVHVFSQAMVRHMCHAVYFQSKFAPDTLERYKLLLAAKQLAAIALLKRDCSYISQEINYLNCLVKFSIGETVTSYSLEEDQLLKTVSEVMERDEILRCLQGYRDPITTQSSRTLQAVRKDSADNISKLVEASNILRDKLPVSELNRIKKVIATSLGVDDIYKNIVNPKAYYGEESDTLEFKTSIVYPPNNHMQPDLERQQWNILKPVCGFLNTVTGGELLLGVNDNGNSEGLDNDIKYLYKAKKISEMSVDKYRNYVKQLIDQAFADDTGMASNTEITTTRIQYVIEHNSDKHAVLHIKVSPYEYGIVQFRAADLPEGIHKAYFRTSGSTLPMNSEIKRQVREKKFSMIGDESTQRILDLQKSLKSKKVVILKNYSSKNGTKDRRVEVSQVLPERKAVICYDLDKKELREYKVTRFDYVQFTDENWKNENKHKALTIDLFGMMQNPKKDPFRLVLKLKRLPYNLLCEEYQAAQRVRENHDDDASEYPYVLDTIINEVQGVGRFYIGLAQEIKIIEGEALKAYALDYMNKVIKEMEK